MSLRSTRWRCAVWFALLGGSAVTSAACGTPPPNWQPDGGACVEYVTPPALDLTIPVSFKTDVMKVFGDSCSSAICHGAVSGSQAGLFLGAESKHGSDAATVYPGLLKGSPETMKKMAFVTPGDPATSYLMHKLDGDQCTLEAECQGHDCKATMPYASQQLVVDKRDTIRRWIAQGAMDN